VSRYRHVSAMKAEGFPVQAACEAAEVSTSADGAEGLYRLVDAAYEKRSVALSSNLHPSGFDQLMDKTIASALVDRLMHHAHVLVTEGESVRLADAVSGKGVVPLAS
jgi:DNA replication protein DnaC